MYSWHLIYFSVLGGDAPHVSLTAFLCLQANTSFVATLGKSCLNQSNVRASENFNPFISFSLSPGMLQSRWLRQDSIKWVMEATMQLTASLPGTFCVQVKKVTLLQVLLVESPCRIVSCP